MRISSITPTSVWGASSRSLTNIGSGALAPTSTVSTSIAGGSGVDVRPSAGILSQNTIGVLTGAGAAAGINITLFDGTNTINLASTAAAAGAAAGFSAISTNGVWTRLGNTDATHAGSYMVSQFSWTI